MQGVANIVLNRMLPRDDHTKRDKKLLNTVPYSPKTVVGCPRENLPMDCGIGQSASLVS